MTPDKIKEAILLNTKLSGNGKTGTKNTSTTGHLTNIPKQPQEVQQAPSAKLMFNPNEEPREAWDPNKALEKIKQGGDMNPTIDPKKSKIPSAILESILKNPLSNAGYADLIDKFTNDIGLGEANIEAIADFSKRVDEIADKRKKDALNETMEQTKNEDEIVTEQFRNLANNSNVEHNQLSSLEQMIESVLDRKLAQYTKALLNESKSNDNLSNIKGFQIRENGKFYFLSSNNDLYECQMKYLGKNKVRKKK